MTTLNLLTTMLPQIRQFVTAEIDFLSAKIYFLNRLHVLSTENNKVYF